MGWICFRLHNVQTFPQDKVPTLDRIGEGPTSLFGKAVLFTFFTALSQRFFKFFFEERELRRPVTGKLAYRLVFPQPGERMRRQQNPENADRIGQNPRGSVVLSLKNLPNSQKHPNRLSSSPTDIRPDLSATCSVARATSDDFPLPLVVLGLLGQSVYFCSLSCHA